MTCKVLLHHYGRFTSPPGRKFVGKMVATVDPVELDSFSTNQVKLILANSLGYDENSPTFFYLVKPNCSLDSGLVPLADAIQDHDMLLTYTQTHHNRLHVYASRVEISPLVVADQRKDERNKKENQEKPSFAGKLQLFVSQNQIVLSTVLFPNDDSLEESFVAKYIFSNASLAEMMNHVITNYTSESKADKREVTKNDYKFDQVVEWAEQEHFEDEETKEVQRQHLKNDHPLIEYGRYDLGCMTGADMKKATYLKMVRDELLRSMEEKRQLIKNYKEM
ncbi:hypothetical protein Tco_0954766 [Tanacetum coccineum]|uniref:Uncharacterized protein n=1 Tax=Tanacetum coccineum TaxID=301880 RepID=A0ABQ5E5B3_9ASTR